jgi:hypothetical protein
MRPMDGMLHHLSEESNIARFVPRLPQQSTGDRVEPVVWAIDEEHLHTYLL